MRIHNVITYYKILFIFQIVFLSDNPDPSTTSLICRLNDPQLFGIFFFQLVYLKPVVVRGEYV